MIDVVFHTYCRSSPIRQMEQCPGVGDFILLSFENEFTDSKILTYHVDRVIWDATSPNMRKVDIYLSRS
jgi:hypothetical protein